MIFKKLDFEKEFEEFEISFEQNQLVDILNARKRNAFHYFKPLSSFNVFIKFNV